MSEENPAQGYLADLTVAVGARGISAAQRKLMPSPLDLVFDRTISGCVHTGPVYAAGTNVLLPAEWLRVGVINSSSTPIECVRVQALKLEPDTLGILPAPLHWKDHNPPPGQPNQQTVAVSASKRRSCSSTSFRASRTRRSSSSCTSCLRSFPGFRLATTS
jgi:hypothetical protein